MPTDLQSILRLEVPLIVRIDRRSMTLDEIVALVPGSIIELGKRADEELDILANNKRVGRGTAVKVGENFGIRVTSVGNLRAKLSALGGDAATVGTAPETTAPPDPETESEPELETQSQP